MTPRMSELQIAFMLLTRLPAGRASDPAPAMASSVWAWPLVGAAVGALAAVAYVLATGLGLTPVMAAIVALAAGALATGGLHEDGLADVADGFGGGRDPRRKLEIMRDSRIGSYGTIALILSLGLRGSAIAALPDATYALVGLAAASRAGLPFALFLMPAARDDGLGHAASGVDRNCAALAAAIGFVCLLPLGFGAAVSVSLAMAVTSAVFAALVLRQIGGQTGDVMGAMQQLAEIAGWIVLVAALS
jgi:adenosylcobinamide-GDP ribazoletransferase